jgi:serine/threonine protein kinase
MSLIEGMLAYLPENRSTLVDVMNHPWMQSNKEKLQKIKEDLIFRTMVIQSNQSEQIAQIQQKIKAPKNIFAIEPTPLSTLKTYLNPEFSTSTHMLDKSADPQGKEPRVEKQSPQVAQIDMTFDNDQSIIIDMQPQLEFFYSSSS